MKPKLKAKWLELLRGGEYAQGRAALKQRVAAEPHERIGYCCLGLLALAANWRFDALRDASNSYALTYAGDASTDHEMGSFSDEQLDVLGLTNADEDRLVIMNDTQRCSFEEIAEWIEGNVK